MKVTPRILALATLLATAPFSAFATLTSDGVHEHRLDNGMKVILKEDHRAPVVTSQVWYRVGSSYEHDGITGVSHVLEHMMFKGTEKYAPGEFSRIIAENGGDENAFTGRDYTAYYQNLAADRLEVSLRMEADRMRNLLLLDEEFQKEVEVVKEERRLRTEDKPNALTSEQFNATAFAASPYRHPVIGWMDDLEQMQIDDLALWYRKWYAPNNATLVIAGDIDPEQTLKLAQKYFGSLQTETLNPPKSRREPVQRGTKQVTVKAPAQQPYLILGYKTPSLNTPDIEPWEPYALEVLSEILDGGASARFSRHLIREQQVAADISTDYSAFTRMGDTFSVAAIPAPGVTVEQLQRAIEEQVDRLKTEPVPEQELKRVRTAVIAGQVYQRDSVFYQAMLIGMLETIGMDWRILDRYPEQIAQISAEQVQAVARKYLTPDHLTIARLDPQAMQPAKTNSGQRALDLRH